MRLVPLTARLRKALNAVMEKTGGASKKIHQTLGPKVKLTRAQEKLVNGAS
jgi:hypothetical protein